MSKFKVGDIVTWDSDFPTVDRIVEIHKDGSVQLEIIDGPSTGSTYSNSGRRLRHAHDYIIKKDIKDWLNDA